MKSELTRKEKEVLLGITMGYTQRQIADMMFLSQETIKTHVRHIKQKIGDEYPKRGKKPLARAFAVTPDGHPLFGVKVVETPEGK
jgi:hypothetical protein